MPAAMAIGAVASVAGAAMSSRAQAKAAKKAGRIGAAAGEAATAALMGNYQKSVNELKTAYDQGRITFEEYYTKAQEFLRPMAESFEESKAGLLELAETGGEYEQILNQRAQEEISRRAAAIGGLQSGVTIEAGGRASQEIAFAQQARRQAILENLAGIGAGALGTQAQFASGAGQYLTGLGSQYGQNLAGLYSGLGQNLANVYTGVGAGQSEAALGVGQAQAGLWSGIGNLGSTAALYGMSRMPTTKTTTPTPTYTPGLGMPLYRTPTQSYGGVHINWNDRGPIV